MLFSLSNILHLNLIYHDWEKLTLFCDLPQPKFLAGKVLLKLGKLQYELHKLVDSYVRFYCYILIYEMVMKTLLEFVLLIIFKFLQRSHIFQTIAVPSESLLNELQTVEVRLLELNDLMKL